MPKKSAYIPELDGLRALSILIVMLGHSGYLLFPAGLGVTIFFVISGYLICGMLLRENEIGGFIDVKAFYVRRILRLYPELLTYLSILLIICEIIGWNFHWIQIVAGVFYFTNYLQIYDNTYTSISFITRPLWSLAVEEHFYLIFPFVIVITKGKVKTVFFILLATIIATGALRLALLDFWHAPPNYFDFATESRIDAVCGGCLLACIPASADFEKVLREFRQHGWWLLLGAVALIIMTLTIRTAHFRDSWRFSLQTVGSTLLLGSIVWGNQLEPVRRLLRLPPLVWIGRLSYATYLYHLLVYVLVAKLFATDSFAYRMTAIALSFAAATVSYWAIEIPILPLRRRFRANPPPEPIQPQPEGTAIPV